MSQSEKNPLGSLPVIGCALPPLAGASALAAPAAAPAASVLALRPAASPGTFGLPATQQDLGPTKEAEEKEKEEEEERKRARLSALREKLAVPLAEKQARDMCEETLREIWAEEEERRSAALLRQQEQWAAELRSRGL